MLALDNRARSYLPQTTDARIRQDCSEFSEADGSCIAASYNAAPTLLQLRRSPLPGPHTCSGRHQEQ